MPPNTDKLNRIKVVLAEQDVSQKKLADMLGISKNAMSAIVNNKSQPSLRRLFYIAGYLNVPPHTLIASYQPIQEEE